jgi:tetratricopeptide (TPR) repeat protein
LKTPPLQILCFWICLALWPLAAQAQDEPVDPVMLSESYYQQAVQLLNEGRYQEALGNLDKAIELNPEPIFYCNRGAVLLRLEQTEEALGSMERCLESVEIADPADKAVLDAEVNALRLAVRRLKPQSRDLAQQIATRPEEEVSGVSVAAWTTGALGGASLLGVLTLELLTQPLVDEYRDVASGGQDRARYDTLRSDIEDRKLLMGALLVSGSVLTLVSGVLLWLDMEEEAEPPSVGVRGLPGGALLDLKVVF